MIGAFSSVFIKPWPRSATSASRVAKSTSLKGFWFHVSRVLISDGTQNNRLLTLTAFHWWLQKHARIFHSQISHGLCSHARRSGRTHTGWLRASITYECIAMLHRRSFRNTINWPSLVGVMRLKWCGCLFRRSLCRERSAWVHYLSRIWLLLLLLRKWKSITGRATSINKISAWRRKFQKATYCGIALNFMVMTIRKTILAC